MSLTAIMPTPDGLFGPVVVERIATGAGASGYDSQGRWQEDNAGGDSGAIDDATVSIANVLNNTTYTLTVNGTDYDFTSDSNATATEIAAGLAAAADAGESGVSITAAAGIITLTKAASSTDRFTVSLDANLKFDEITLTIVASAQPHIPGLRDAILEREGERLRGELLVITNESLRTVDDEDASDADVVRHQGDRFEVMREEPYVQGIVDHKEYIARRLKE